jgi:Fe2+ transport system protein FeoA
MSDTETVLQLTFKNGAATSRRTRPSRQSLKDLKKGEHGVLDSLELPDDMARRLMELGFLPGSRITAAHAAPGGDPKVFRVDGSEIALRRETAARLYLRREADPVEYA